MEMEMPFDIVQTAFFCIHLLFNRRLKLECIVNQNKKSTIYHDRAARCFCCLCFWGVGNISHDLKG